MRIVVTGASGFIGARLVASLLNAGTLDGRTIDEIIAVDIVTPAVDPHAADPRLRRVDGDASDAALLARAIQGGVDSVFALGASLTADAELHFARGMEINLHGMLRLLEACRTLAERPKLVFTSSIATFGGPLPEVVHDDLPLTPQTSYGTQKAISELLIDDYTRRGWIDGRSLRLPIVLVRPGAAAGTISDRIAAIVREPLAGRDAVCPLARDTLLPLASAHGVARALVAVHDLPAAAHDHTRAMNLPSMSVTVGELADAVQAAAKRRGINGLLGRIDWQPDAALQAIVDAWPRRFESARAAALGLRGDASVDEIIDHYIDDHVLPRP